MQTLDPTSTQTRSQSFLVIDQMRLRRECIVKLLQGWAEEHALQIIGLAPTSLPSAFEHEPNCAMIVLSVGGQSIASSETAGLFNMLASLMSDAALVVMSDRDEASEAIETFRNGGSGFIPSSMDPDVARSALTFILAGGTYFPPIALLESSHTKPLREPSKPEHRAGRSGRDRESLANELTHRQLEVCNLLSRGLSNKLIARQLNMTEATVKVHVRHVMRKLGASNRTQAALNAISLANVCGAVKVAVAAAPPQARDEAPLPARRADGDGISRRPGPEFHPL